MTLSFFDIQSIINGNVQTLYAYGVFVCEKNMVDINAKYILDRPIPTRIQKIQKMVLFFNPNLSKMVGSKRRARMSVNADIDKQEATSALLIPVDQVPSKSLPIS